METGSINRSMKSSAGESALDVLYEPGAGTKGTYKGVGSAVVSRAVNELKQETAAKPDNGLQAGYERLVADLQATPTEDKGKTPSQLNSSDHLKAAAFGVSGDNRSQAPPMLAMPVTAQHRAAMVDRLDARLDKVDATLEKVESQLEKMQVQSLSTVDSKPSSKMQQSQFNPPEVQAPITEMQPTGMEKEGSSHGPAPKAESYKPAVANETTGGSCKDGDATKAQKAYDAMERSFAKDGFTDTERSALNAFADKCGPVKKEAPASFEQLVRSLIDAMKKADSTDNLAKALSEILGQQRGKVSIEDVVNAAIAMSSDGKFSEADLAAFKDLLSAVGDTNTTQGGSSKGGVVNGGGGTSQPAPTYTDMLQQLFISPHMQGMGSQGPLTSSFDFLGGLNMKNPFESGESEDT
jgi:hypothetical protein